MSAPATIRRLQSHAKLFKERVLDASKPSADPTQLAFFDTLALAASQAADSLLCSSILAGHGSESDEFADAGVYLGQGDFAKGNEKLVLSSLGLEAGKITPVPLNNHIPSTVRGEDTAQLSEFRSQVSQLEHLYCFSNQTGSNSDIIFALIGSRAGAGWGGLLGIGTWSDD
ncbi:hypothetical protein MKEN_00671500 [Mycena kentingensis (nom. inval.)]|nr:hypothetical protein MKEN_00671500 [Mycena kentingensis (nom. inval.)]